MYNSMNEITEHFNLIKDHKPKATKKLNELGDILASAYKIDARKADEMWQYLVKLNVYDDSSNSKFYIAQVFNKLIDRLKPEEATELLTITPERVQLMILYGYEGGTMWKCLDTLIKGYLMLESIDNAEVCVELFYNKFGGIQSGVKEILEVTKKTANICADLWESGEYREEATELLLRMEHSMNEEITLLIKLIKTIREIETCEDFNQLFMFARVKKYPVEFFDLLWVARTKYRIDELRDKWIEYIDDCEEGDIRPYNYLSEVSSDYSESKLFFYVELEKNADELLDYYFDRQNLYDVEKGVIWSWIEEDKWDKFSKYISLVIMATDNENFEYSSIKRELEDYMKACFYGEYIDSRDAYSRSYKSLMMKKGAEFAAALSKICVITTGCDCHESYHIFIKEFVQKQNGDLSMLNELGFSDSIETRSAEERLKDYVHNFISSGEESHQGRPVQYTIILDALREELQGTNDLSGFTIDMTSLLLNALTNQKKEDEPKEDKKLEQSYRLASDDEIANFYFFYCPDEYEIRKDFLSACIRKRDINRAIELIDIMGKTRTRQGYEDRNGFGRKNMLSIKSLIREYDYRRSEEWDKREITDEMREDAKELVYRIMPYLPDRSQDEIKDDLYKIDPDNVNTDEYVSHILEEVEIYTTFPKPKGKSDAPTINRMSEEIWGSFVKLETIGRLDVIVQIMKKFISVGILLKPVAFDTWLSTMAKELSKESILLLYRSNPEIFEDSIEIEGVRDWVVVELARKLGEKCSRAEFLSYRNYIISKRGMIEGLDDAFTATSDNTETQTIFDGNHVKIELDYVEVIGNNPISTIGFHLLTTKKTQELRSIRIKRCIINNIETYSLGSYSDFEDDGPSAGYSVFKAKNTDEITVYSDFFEDNTINQVNKIDMELVLMDADGNLLEELSEVVIEHDDFTGEYKVTKEATSKNVYWKTTHSYDENDDVNVKYNISELLRTVLENDVSKQEVIEEDYNSEDEFEDIEIYDDMGVRVEFCGMEFYSNYLGLRIWCYNFRNEKTTLFIKSLKVNENSIMQLNIINSVEAKSGEYSDIDVFGNEEFSYEEISNLELIIEVDDENNDELGNTKQISIKCDTFNETFSIQMNR